MGLVVLQPPLPSEQQLVIHPLDCVRNLQLVEEIAIVKGRPLVNKVAETVCFQVLVVQLVFAQLVHVPIAIKLVQIINAVQRLVGPIVIVKVPVVVNSEVPVTCPQPPVVAEPVELVSLDLSETNVVTLPQALVSKSYPPLFFPYESFLDASFVKSTSHTA